MPVLKRIHLSYWVIGIAILSVGAASSARALLEIGPIATVTAQRPQIHFNDTNGGTDWSIDAQHPASGNHLAIGPDPAAPQALLIDSVVADQTLVVREGGITINNDGEFDSGSLDRIFPLVVNLINSVFGGESRIALAPTDVETGAFTILQSDFFPANSFRQPVFRILGVPTGLGANFTGCNELMVAHLDGIDGSLLIGESGDVGIGGYHTSFQDNAFNMGLRGDLDINGEVIYFDSAGPRWDWANLATDDFYSIESIDVPNAVETRPFSIEVGAPDNGFNMNDFGDVAMGTASPDSSLHVYRNDGSAQLKVEEDSPSVANRALFELVNNGGVRMALDNLSANERWEFFNNSVGDFNITRNGSGGTEFAVTRAGGMTVGPGSATNLSLRPSGNLFIAGTLFESSDREKKENFEEVDCDEVLQQVVEMPITTWNYKSDEEEVRHMGPVAQDFRSAFQLGDSDKTIATTDKVGVSLAAIKALNAKLEAELDAKDDEIDELTARLERLEAALENVGH